jgi:hypothetical protein
LNTTHPLRWLALIGLDQPALPDEKDVCQELARQFPAAPPLIVANSTPRLITGTFGQLTVAATLVPHPIPWTQLEGPCATAWYWPQAADSLRKHSAHLLVTLVDESGQAVEKSNCLTQFVTALTTALSLEGSSMEIADPVLGIFWGPSRMVHPCQAFVEQALQMTLQNLPLYLWIDFRIETSQSEQQPEIEYLRLYTTGLEALGQSELEVPHYQGNPQQLLELVYNVAHYLVEKRKAVNDGDTIGLTDQVQATIRHSKSMLDGTTDTLWIEFQSE